MPSVDLDVIHADDIPLPLEGPFPVEESLSLSFSRLLQVISEEEWNSIMKECEQYHIVYLKDDVLIVNEEIFPFKEMYIKVWCRNGTLRCTCGSSAQYQGCRYGRASPSSCGYRAH